MIIYPNSAGSDHGAWLVEFNPCHDPETGQFTFRGAGDCGPGSPSAKGRNRAIFGQMVPDEEGLAFDAREAEKATAAISPVSTNADQLRRRAKDKIARELAKSIVNHPDLGALATDPVLGGFLRRYEPEPGDSPRDVLARNVASELVETWARSSSDHQVRSLALQLIAEQHFGLGATYASTITRGGGHYLLAVEALTRHAPILSTFVQAMYDNTQAWLDKKGVGKNGYVTLYRGWAASTAQEPGLETVDAKHGSAVDVLLQPLSSFSSDFGTARTYAAAGRAPGPHKSFVMAVRVPRHRIISTARTGIGCLFESEYVVLGGRYPAFVQDYRRNRDARGFLGAALRWLPPKKGIEIGPGDRL